MSDLVAKHVEFVRAVVEGTQKAPNPRVAQSWTRCLKEHCLDPGKNSAPPLVSRSDLARRQQELAALLSIARIEISNLLRYVAGTGHAILFCDPDSVILNYSGDRAFNATAKKLGLQLGALWGEPHQGTNAQGTCLADGEPVIVRGNEHFMARNLVLSSVSAPILDPQGKLIAGLSASSETQNAQEHTLALVKMAAEAIENRYLLSLYKEAIIIRFHSRPEFIMTLGAGLILVNSAGRCIAGNRSAAFHLGYASVTELLGKDIGELFNVSLEVLASRREDADSPPQALYETRNGRRFYTLVNQPEPEGGRTIPTAPPVTSKPSGPESSAATCSTFGAVTLEDLGFGDKAMAYNIQCANRILNHDISILLYGETGTGKELFSKALHNCSDRAGKPYVAVNCASIPETLIESELFGYKGGAFTGARREGNRGKIAQANGGTLFLDEIGDMPLTLQGRLLRVLEEREVLPLGSDTPIKVDIRLVSATNRHLRKLIEQGLFREDLYYRLEGVCITLPPLRERQDIIHLIRRMMEIENGGKPIEIEESAMEKLVEYRWPGNLRQLGNTLRILLALRDGEIIAFDDLPQDIRQGHTLSVPEPESPRKQQARKPDLERNGHAGNPLKTAEREVLLQALENDYWSITRIAKRFNVSRNTIYRKMKAHNIRPPPRS